MTSSSNSSALAQVTLPKKRNNNYYDVFVTFRGDDTRNNITDFLFNALEDKGILVFRDDTNLTKGESIAPALLRAIEDSQIFVVIFSMNYAFSTWCLQELEKICECSQVSGKHILPVFYDVDPSEVRKQSGIFAKAFVKHKKRFKQDYDMVQRWRKALTHVGAISGWDMRHKQQYAQIKEIVQRIRNILDCKSSAVSKDLVGMGSPIQELENHLLLESVDNVHVVGICGKAMSLLTTLATALYAKVSFVNETTNKSSFSSVSSEKSQKLADILEPINIAGEQETGIRLHQPGNEVCQTWEPRKGKNRCLDTKIFGKSNDLCDSSSSDDNTEYKLKMETVRKGLHKISSVYRRSQKKYDIPSPHDNIRSVIASKWVGLKFVMDDNIGGFPVGKLQVEGRSPEGSGGPDSPVKRDVKDMAKNMYKHAEKSAHSLEHVLSRKPRKSKGDSAASVQEVENESDSSDDESSLSVQSPIDERICINTRKNRLIVMTFGHLLFLIVMFYMVKEKNI